MQNINTEFDFDKWAKLAKDDPDAYEDMRKQMIQDVIEKASPQVKQRMEGLQWQIDQIRSTSANPMSSCLKISQMMWEKVTAEDGLLVRMRQLNEPTQLPDLNTPKESATVINLNRNITDQEKS